MDNTEDFTGTLYKYDMTGATKQIRAFEKGKSFSPIKKESPDLPGNTKYEPSIWDDPSSGWITITTAYYRDYWEVGQNDSGEPYARYLGSYKYDERTEHVYVPSNRPSPGLGNNAGDDNYHQHVNAPHGPSGRNPHNYEKEVEEKPVKIINELKGKEGCINGLLDEKGDSYVKDLLSNFKGDSEFDIRIESVNKIVINGETMSGRAFPPNSGVIRIQINSASASTRPVLDVARTILHEYIHADMYRKLNTRHTTSDVLDFRTTYEKYENEIFEASAQHETIAELYIDEMSSALRSFHEDALPNDFKYLTNNGQNPLPDSFYEGLAWRGLKDHGVEAYNKLSPEKKAALKESVTLYYPSTTKSCPN